MGTAATPEYLNDKERFLMSSDFDIRDGILYKYTGNEPTVVIPDSVSRIYEKAFRGCSTVVSIEIPNSVTWIDWGAFSFCENLKCIKLPSSLEFISVSAIEGSKRLKSIIMENNKNYYVRDNRIFRIGDDNDVISNDILK